MTNTIPSVSEVLIKQILHQFHVLQLAIDILQVSKDEMLKFLSHPINLKLANTSIVIKSVDSQNRNITVGTVIFRENALEWRGDGWPYKTTKDEELRVPISDPEVFQKIAVKIMQYERQHGRVS